MIIQISKNVAAPMNMGVGMTMTTMMTRKKETKPREKSLIWNFSKDWSAKSKFVTSHDDNIYTNLKRMLNNRERDPGFIEVEGMNASSDEDYY